MTKVNYLRKHWEEKYNENDLSSAAEVGEALLREHWHNKNMQTTGYANDLFNLACVHDELGNLNRAAELYSDSARQLSEMEGEGLTFAERVNNLAIVLIRLGVTEPAFFMLGNATAIRRRELGENSPLYADSLYNLANAAANAGRRKDSIYYHTEALKIRQKEGNTEEIINSLHSLAFIYESAAEYEKAVPYAEAALKHSTGDEDVFARSCNYLATLYENCKKFNAALPLYEMVMEITEIKAGNEHSAYINTALRRANLLTLMNKTNEALAAYGEIRDVFIRAFGTNHISYANCLRGIAVLQRMLNNPRQAEELITEAMKIRRTLYEDITLDITFLINLYLQENDREKAIEALVYALMCCGKDSNEFNELLQSMEDIFVSKESPDISVFINAVELINDKEKLRPIIDKWEEWERD